MGLTVVVGGQYGSEGKGKMVSYLAMQNPGSIVVRCGGTNAGHTANFPNQQILCRVLPIAVFDETAILCISAGACISVDLLFDEMEKYHVSPRRVRIDPHAMLIEERDYEEEKSRSLSRKIGSTLSGTGAATSRKIWRSDGVRLAKDETQLCDMVQSVSAVVEGGLAEGRNVIIEGTQGYGLSIHHGTYPYVTSRDTTAAGFCSESGVSPRAVDRIIMVVRTYPIRVAGNSGPLHGEITWREIEKRSGYPYEVVEYTTVTKNIRRVGEFDFDLFRRAIAVNRPSEIAIHGVDYLNYGDLHCDSYESLSVESRSFIEQLEELGKVNIRYIFTGGGAHDIIDRERQAIQHTRVDRSISKYSRSIAV